MSETARQLSQEFWRPAQPSQSNYGELRAEAHCGNCGTQLAPGARFCHVCGSEREPDTRARLRHGMRMPNFNLDRVRFENIRQKIGLSAVSTVLLFAAAFCVLATLAVGLFYKAETMAEWQAVQTWRIEWMLATLVALVGAVLFKNPTSSE